MDIEWGNSQLPKELFLGSLANFKWGNAQLLKELGLGSLGRITYTIALLYVYL